MSICPANVASEEYADFIYRHNNLPLSQLYELQKTYCIDYVDAEFAIVHSPLEELLPISISRYYYTSIPKLYTLLDTTSMEASGIISTFNQPNLNVRGEGVMIGIIDTGIDYQNPLFRNPDGSSRILGIWDQSIPDANGPLASSGGIPGLNVNDTFLYGTEYTQEQINEALKSDSPLEIVPSIDESGHGTFMAGIAAGGVSPTEDFIGAAPNCNLVIVKLKPAKQYLRDFYQIKEEATAYQENDIMLGIRYLQLSALRKQMPLVICLGLGTNSGSHDGNSPLGLLFRNLSRYIGLCSVIAAGNEAGLRHHFLGNIQQDQEYEDVELRVAPDEKGFVVELWATEPELYTVGFVSPTGEVIQKIPFALGSENRITFKLETTQIYVNYVTSEVGSGSQLIFMRFIAPTAGIWHIRVYNALFITGLYHMWLPVQGFISENTVFLRANPDTTITNPANASYPITVSTYNHNNNSIYIHSSRGYTRSNQIKPDLAAPGVNVYGPALPPVSQRDLPRSMDSQSPMTYKTGSSIAAAHVAGAAANIMSWSLKQGNTESLSDATIKSYLIRGANRRPGFVYPNREWGYGTLDLYQSFLR